MIEYIVTGGTGWLGKNLVDILLSGSPDFDNVSLLGEGKKIRVLCLASELSEAKSHANPQVEYVAGDITEKRTLEPLFQEAEGATLIHLAGLIHPKLWVSDFDKVNFVGTRNVVELAIQSKIKKSVVMSSNSPFGCNPNNEHLFT
ncbi:MAG: NAD(P)-dependent oxidoreductase, partial [Cyanobacteria bacterium P01_F01_bin.86]